MMGGCSWGHSISSWSVVLICEMQRVGDWLLREKVLAEESTYWQATRWKVRIWLCMCKESAGVLDTGELVIRACSAIVDKGLLSVFWVGSRNMMSFYCPIFCLRMILMIFCEENYEQLRHLR